MCEDSDVGAFEHNNLETFEESIALSSNFVS